MRRILPESLLGQMLLAVGLALLAAQVIAGIFLYRATSARAEAEIVNGLAFQIIVDWRDPQGAYRGFPDRPRGPRRERRRQRAEALLEAALGNPSQRDPARERALGEVLDAQGIAGGTLVVLDPLPPREVALRRDSPEPRRRVVAGFRPVDDDTWRIAAHDLPPRAASPLRGIVMQTLILYLVLVGGLALLLRRITRPIADLTRRVEAFGGDTAMEPLAASGPRDTRQLITAHNAMESRIAALLDEKDVMLGAIGHDLKTPLAALRVRIESVEDEAERARMAAGIEDITRTLDDILSLARVGRPSDPLERTDLAALIAGVVEEYEDMGEPVVFGPSERVALPVRETWLRRAMRNLVDNALRYGGDARVSLATDGDTAMIRIADSGPGIPEDRLEAMLEPFARGEGSRNRATGGAGLGLTLARAIAEQHGGALVLANGSEGGLLAELRLPLHCQ
ncbi:MAG: ATP-binding protein [Alteraurantiacibacter sp.]